MSTGDSLLAAIRRLEPTLTSLVMRERPDGHRASIQVASFAGLTTAGLAILNAFGPPSQSTRSAIEAVIQGLPSLVGQETVRVDQVLLEAGLVAQARNQIHGANATNAPTALSLAYNLCGEDDMKKMLSLDKGPLGQIGGIAAVLSQRLLGPDKAANIMMETVSLVGALVESVSPPSAPSHQVASRGTGCAIASIALLSGGVGGLAAVVRYVPW